MEPAIRRTESQVEGTLGHALFRRSWLHPEPRRALLLLHGYAEHSGRYEHVGAWFAARGCAVHAYDQQGHGRSGGPRGHVGRFDDFLDDVDRVLGIVGEEHPGLPRFVVGHSMGGLIAAAHARERHPDVAGVALSGPLLAVSESMPRWRIAVARALRRVRPRLSLASGLDANGLSRDPAVVEAYLADPLVFRTLTVSLAAEMMDAVTRTAAGAADVKVPMLLLHGEDDPLCNVEGSRAFYDALTVPKELRTYPGLRHEIFNEPEREQVFGDLWSWLESAQA